jgi:hypothetical protein
VLDDPRWILICYSVPESATGFRPSTGRSDRRPRRKQRHQRPHGLRIFVPLAIGWVMEMDIGTLVLFDGERWFRRRY